jgi:hypothetical protein
MDIPALLSSLESTAIATRIRDGLYLFPLLEAIHVFGLAMVFGTIMIIDLRLLGAASTNRSFKRMASDILKWTWAGFAVTAATGFLMFITNAGVYYNNTVFRAKMVMLVLAGVNMFIFELTAGRSKQNWDKSPSAPTIGKATAVLSLAFWISIIFLGRWIGFTTTRATPVVAPADINFDDLFGGTDTQTPEAPPDKK